MWWLVKGIASFFCVCVPVVHQELQHTEVQDIRNDGSTPLIVALEGAPAKVKNDTWQNSLL